jgi:protein-S-isoprenylcysteine O-methyltransferase Ste14
MPKLTLALFTSFLLLAFGWRRWIQYRRTGDTGLRRPSRGAGAAEWFAWLALLCGGALSYAAPLLASAGRLRLARFAADRFAIATGLVALAAGAWLTLRAQLQMGVSWRIGVDPKERTALVTHGVFGWVRNPIFSGMLLGLVGVALLVPHALSFAGLAVVALGIELQVRRVEEPYLLRTHGDAYRAYARSAGRFVPGFGRLERNAS